MWKIKDELFLNIKHHNGELLRDIIRVGELTSSDLFRR